MHDLYDRADSESIKNYAIFLLEHCLRDFLSEEQINDMDINTRNRGRLGQLIEKYFFEYSPNNFGEPDFPEAGLELKVTPIKKLSNGDLRSKERLVLNIINYMEEYKETFESSSFWKKNSNLLIMFYLFSDDSEVIDYLFKFIDIYDYTPKDLFIIRQDWEKIISFIKAGKAHQLSERFTLYLSACRKGSGNDTDYRPQPFSDEPALQRAYSFKQKFMNIILDRWQSSKQMEDLGEILTPKDYESTSKTFEELVLEKINVFRGMKVDEIENKIGLSINHGAKNFYSRLALKMLGTNKNKAEEFEKADITIKTIRLNNKNMPKEAISFPYIRYKEIVYEDWENSTLHDRLDKRFFFMIFKEDSEGKLVFLGAKFWSMPYEDLEFEVKNTWNLTRQNIIENDFENFPKISDTRVCHVRPHARNAKDLAETTNGELKPKKSFWLNAGYIKDSIIDNFDY